MDFNTWIPPFWKKKDKEVREKEEREESGKVRKAERSGGWPPASGPIETSLHIQGSKMKTVISGLSQGRKRKERE